MNRYSTMPIFSKIVIRAPLFIADLAISAISLAQSPRALTESGTVTGVRESGRFDRLRWRLHDGTRQAVCRTLTRRARFATGSR